MTRTTYACLAIQDHAQGAMKLKGYGTHDNVTVCEMALTEAGQMCPASLLLHVSVSKKVSKVCNP
jgi:thiamine monophosphate synthase